MHVDVFIVGQGICGTFLSWELHSGKKLSFAVIDRNDAFSSSKVASGLINPVTGRIIATSWLIEELIPFCREKYAAISATLNHSVIAETSITAIASTPQMQQAYEKRLHEENSFIVNAPTTNPNRYFNHVEHCYGIAPVLLVDLNSIITIWKQILINENLLITDSFDESQLIVEETKIRYKHITADKIIYAGGVDSFNSRYWKNLPYALNKGQALILDIPELPVGEVYKFPNVTLVPWQHNLWWAGSTYERSFEDEKPDPAFLNKTIAELKSILKIPFTVVDHLASIRPASVERRPFVGFHPQFKNVGILDGMGTKGCSLAPYFAYQLNESLTENSEINPLANVSRFSSALQR